MRLTITITGLDGTVKARAEDTGSVALVYSAPYEEGDSICLASDSPGCVVAQMEDSLSAVLGYLAAPFLLKVPFGERRVCYSPKNFTGDLHLLWARAAQEHETGTYRNLAYNPLDSHDNTGFFPHATANVETRGESVFAGRNAIDGFCANAGHGPWPYQSWGINRREDAELTIDFGRPVTVDRLVLTLRADFPHDNWWRRATVRFSDGSEETLSLIKTAAAQAFDIIPRTVRTLTLCEMKKDETDPSPFPALTQLEAWGG